MPVHFPLPCLRAPNFFMSKSDIQIFTSDGRLTSMMSTPLFRSALLGMFCLRINSALWVMYGSFIMLATAWTSSPFVKYATKLCLPSLTSVSPWMMTSSQPWGVWPRDNH